MPEQWVRVNQCIRFPLNLFRFLLPRLLALSTEAWRGAESRRRSVEKVYIDLPGPLSNKKKTYNVKALVVRYSTKKGRLKFCE